MLKKIWRIVLLGLFMILPTSFVYAGDISILDKEIEEGETIEIKPDFSKCKVKESYNSQEMMSRRIKIQINKKDLYSFYWTSYHDSFSLDYYMDLYDEEGNYIKSLNDVVDEIEPGEKNVFGPIIYDLDEGIYYISFCILNYNNNKYMKYNCGKNVDFSYGKYVFPKKGDIIKIRHFTYKVKKECVVDLKKRKCKKRGKLELISVEKNNWKNIYIDKDQLYWGTSTLTWGTDGGSTYGGLLYNYDIVRVSCTFSETCRYLKSVTFYCDGISNNTYKDLRKLKKFKYLVLKVKKLPKNGLSNLRSVEEIHFEGKSINIPKKCFCNCKKLKKIDFMCERIVVGKKAFTGCKKLNEIYFSYLKFKKLKVSKTSFYTKANSKLIIDLYCGKRNNRIKNILEKCSFSNKVIYKEHEES